MLEIHSVIHLITEIRLNLKLFTKYAGINAENLFTVHLNTVLVFKYLPYSGFFRGGKFSRISRIYSHS